MPKNAHTPIEKIAPEEWREIVGCPGYWVSEFGRVRSRLRVLTLQANHAGYLRVGLMVSGKLKMYRVNVLVCSAFHGPKPTKESHAAHKNGLRKDNRATNLRWRSKAENEAEKIAHGTVLRGSDNGRAILSEAQVAKIKRRLGSCVVDIAKDFGVDPQTVRRIAMGKGWTHVDSALVGPAI